MLKNERLLQDEMKKKQKMEQEEIKKTQKLLKEKVEERKILEDKVKELQSQTTTLSSSSSDTKFASSAVIGDDATYPILLESTRKLDDVAKYYRTRIAARTDDLSKVRVQLQDSRNKRQMDINEMTSKCLSDCHYIYLSLYFAAFLFFVDIGIFFLFLYRISFQDDFDTKRDELASYHQDVREELPSTNAANQRAIARLEDQHSRLLGDTKKILKLLSTRTPSSQKIATKVNTGMTAADAGSKSTRSYAVEIFLYKHRYQKDVSNHPSKMCGIETMFTKITAADASTLREISVNGLIIQLNEMALDAPILFQNIYERATLLFASMIGGKSTQCITRDDYMAKIQSCEDALVQGLLLSNHTELLVRYAGFVVF